MRKVSVERPKKTSLRKPDLKGHSFLHGSMFGTYQTPCHIIKDLGNGIVLIEYFDFNVDEWLEREIPRKEVKYG